MRNPEKSTRYHRTVGHPVSITHIDIIRAGDSADITVRGLPRDCAVGATIKNTLLRLTAKRPGGDDWEKCYEMPDKRSAVISKIYRDSIGVHISVRFA